MEKDLAEGFLTEHQQLLISQPRLLFIEAGNTGCAFLCTVKERKQKTVLEPADKGWLITHPTSIFVESGNLSYKLFNCMHLVKLQAFIDQSSNCVIDSIQGDLSVFLTDKYCTNPSIKSSEYWFVNKVLTEPESLKYFINILRSTECYGLVRFLLNESVTQSNDRLYDMSKRYGLSASHFRRLSSRALGNTTKVELRDWRLARALFDLMGEKKNMTTIAMNHGYASLSHFSNEVKNALGVSPRSLKKIMLGEAIK